MSALVTVGGLVMLVVYYVDLSRFFGAGKAGQGELFKVCLTVVGGIGALIALYYSARRVRTMEKGNVDTRFNNAVGHLGSDNATVVQGGIHALHQIAVGNREYTRVVHNLFCSFLRENSAKLYEGIDFDTTPDKCPVIIQALIDYLFRPYNGKESVYKDFPADLSFGTFINCKFMNLSLNNTCFSRCNLKKCYFYETELNECKFVGTTLIKCGFAKTMLNKCNFMGATLEECCTWGNAILECCCFAGTTLNKCNLDNSKNINTNFQEAILNDTVLPLNEK
ncbi:MAG: pentapeptide repeat-containing protein [Rikenellaceae bacterium]|nr:pentapeptide repeat-containing protein [Rikenellaceae bacterium]